MQAILSFIIAFILAFFAPTSGFATECGACGAHVHEWHYVTSRSTGELVPVCDECYSNYIENTALETIEIQRMEAEEAENAQ